MIIASYYFGCVGEILKIVSILGAVGKGYVDLIRPDPKKFSERDDSNEIINAVIKKFSHSSGDYLTLLNIYNSTLHYMDNEEQRINFVKIIILIMILF